MLNSASFFNLSGYPHPQLIPEGGYVWEGLNNLKEYLLDYSYVSIFSSPPFATDRPLDRTIILHEGTIIDGRDYIIQSGDTTKGGLAVYHGQEQLEGASVITAGAFFTGDKIAIGKGVLIETGAFIRGPAIIGDHTEVRQGAYLRGNIVTGKGCVLGHTSEIKHAIFLDNAKAGHFNYIGDSILGNDVNLGAGTKLANLKFISGNIFIEDQGELIDTGRRKFGAILGDNSQTGCNSVTNPGTILGKESFVMPNTTAKSGYHEPGSVIR